MLKNAIAALILVAALPAVAAEQIKVAGDGTISLGEWGKVLNSVVFARKSPSDPAIYGSLMVQMNVLQLMNSQPAKASPDGACRPLVGGTEVQLVRIAEMFHDVICVRPHEEQNCLWVFKPGIVSTYDRGEIGTAEMLSLSNKFFDHIHPECEGWPESTNYLHTATSRMRRVAREYEFTCTLLLESRSLVVSTWLGGTFDGVAGAKRTVCAKLWEAGRVRGRIIK